MKASPEIATPRPVADESLLRRVEASAVRRPAQRLRVSYAVGLALVGGLTIGAYFLVRGALLEQRTDAAVVNVAGRQRMLSQRIAKAALALAPAEERATAVGGGRAALVAELHAAAKGLRTGHAALAAGDATLGVDATDDPEATRRLAELGPTLDRLVLAAESGRLADVLVEQAAFLPAQDELVSRYAELARAKVATLERDHLWLLWATLGLLVLEALMVFEPAARAMRRQLRCLHEAGEVMTHEARHDGLTGLPNRNALLAHLEGLLSPPAGGPPAMLAVYFLDFDGFKSINDSLGHDAGDRLLQEIAVRCHRLHEGTRVGRLSAFRLGGDEFVLVLDGRGEDLDGAVRPLADRALAAFAEPVELVGQSCVSTASIGVARFSGGGLPEVAGGGPVPATSVTASELLRNADVAMMQAKAAGKSRCIEFDAAMYRFAQRRRALEEGLRAAVAADDLRLRYLPIVSAGGGELVGAEALLHWEHPRMGVVGNAELMDVAQESGLIHELGAWVFDAVGRDVVAAGAASEGPLPRVHVNVSRAEAVHPGFLERVRGLLSACPVLRGRLCLEFEEAVFSRGASDLAGLLGGVAAEGAACCIDNVGGSHSSLADLARLRVDHIKLNLQALCPGGEVSADALLVPRAVSAFARGVGTSVIAAGIDRPELLALGLDLGAAELEGFHFGAAAGLAEVLDRGGDAAARAA